MEMRTIYARILANESKMKEFREFNGDGDIGPVELFDEQFRFLRQSGFMLDEAALVDEGSDDSWERYIKYVHDWAFTHNDTEQAKEEGWRVTEKPMGFGKWKNMCDMGDLTVAAANLIDVFEEFLRERGISVWNPERDVAVEDSDDPDTVGLIYGSDYYTLEDSVVEMLKSLGLAKELG